MVIFSVSRLDARIVELQGQLDALKADFARDAVTLKTKIERLQAVRAQITPEMELLLEQLNAALG